MIRVDKTFAKFMLPQNVEEKKPPNTYRDLYFWAHNFGIWSARVGKKKKSGIRFSNLRPSTLFYYNRQFIASLLFAIHTLKGRVSHRCHHENVTQQQLLTNWNMQSNRLTLEYGKLTKFVMRWRYSIPIFRIQISKQYTHEQNRMDYIQKKIADEIL